MSLATEYEIKMQREYDEDAPLEKGYQTTSAQRWHQNKLFDDIENVAQECPVAFVYNGISHVVMMATPKNLDAFALGFSLSEGIIKNKTELHSVDITKLDAGYTLDITISNRRMVALKDQRRNLTGRTGCGLCGAQSLDQAIRPINILKKNNIANNDAIQHALSKLTEQQTMQSFTGAFHCAAWCDEHGNIMHIIEDVGRHNALDKLIGTLYKHRILGEKLTVPQSGFTLVSSRASYEMVHKSASVGIHNLVAVSAPTLLAIKLAQQSNINLIGFARVGRHTIYHQAR